MGTHKWKRERCGSGNKIIFFSLFDAGYSGIYRVGVAKQLLLYYIILFCIIPNVSGPVQLIDGLRGTSGVYV